MIALVNLARSHAFSHSCSATGYKQHRKRKSTCNRRSRSETVTGAFAMLCAFMPLANTVEKQNKTFVIFRSGMAAIHSQHISHSVVNYSYDELLCFWTHRINYFDIFSYFHKSVMYCVLRILFMVQTLIGDIVHKPTVFPVYVFEFALVFFCLDRLKINQHSLGSLPVMLVL